MTAIRCALAACLAAAVGCSREPALVTRPADPPRALVIRNVRVFDAPNAVLLDGLRDVVVRDGTIAAVAPPGQSGDGARIVDGNGGTLLPGLVDMHTHTGSTAAPPWKVGILPDVPENLAAFLYAGVTTVLDLGNLTPAVFATRERVRSGEDLGPRLYAVGPVFTAPGGHPAEVLRAWLPWYLRWYVVPRATREVGTPDEARRAVAELATRKPDLLKIADDAGARDDVPRLTPQTMAAVIAAGREAGVRTIVHIGTSREAIDAVRAGAAALAHAPWREEISDDAVAAIAAAKIPVVPTLAVWDATETARREADYLPIEREVASPDVLRALLDTPPAADEAMQAHQRVSAAAHAARRRNVQKLHAAGVALLPGSDAANYGQFPGAGLHLELAKLVEAGLSPADALRAATWESARFLAGGDADFGEIAPGKRADFVLVSGDPLTRIADLSTVTAVVLDGAPLERRTPAH